MATPLNVDDAIAAQIEALLAIPPKASEVSKADLDAIKTRLTTLESRTIPPNLSLEVATLQQSAGILANKMTAAEQRITAAEKAIATPSDIARQLHVKSVNAPNEAADTMFPLWQTWLQEGGKDGREYTALYFRSANPNDAKKIWEKVGAIIETVDQAGNSTYIGIAGVNLKYKKTRNADLSYSFWVTMPPNTLVNNSLTWIAYDANGQECDRGVIPIGDGSESLLFARTQTRYISLQFYWSDVNRPVEVWNIAVSGN